MNESYKSKESVLVGFDHFVLMKSKLIDMNYYSFKFIFFCFTGENVKWTVENYSLLGPTLQ